MTAKSRTASVSPAMNDHRMFDDGDADAQRSLAATGMDEGLRVLSYLISGVLCYGGLGWVGDHYLHTRFLLPIGIIVGAAFGVYVIIKRFGQGLDAVPTRSPAPGTTSAHPRVRRPSAGPDTTEGAS